MAERTTTTTTRICDRCEHEEITSEPTVWSQPWVTLKVYGRGSRLVGRDLLLCETCAPQFDEWTRSGS